MSQLASSRDTTAASSPQGRDASRQPATAGTDPVSGTGTCPATCKNRSSARTAFTRANQLLLRLADESPTMVFRRTRVLTAAPSSAQIALVIMRSVMSV